MRRRLLRILRMQLLRPRLRLDHHLPAYVLRPLPHHLAQLPHSRQLRRRLHILASVLLPDPAARLRRRLLIRILPPAFSLALIRVIRIPRLLPLLPVRRFLRSRPSRSSPKRPSPDSSPTTAPSARPFPPAPVSARRVRSAGLAFDIMFATASFIFDNKLEFFPWLCCCCDADCCSPCCSPSLLPDGVSPACFPRSGRTARFLTLVLPSCFSPPSAFPLALRGRFPVFIHPVRVRVAHRVQRILGCRFQIALLLRFPPSHLPRIVQEIRVIPASFPLSFATPHAFPSGACKPNPSITTSVSGAFKFSFRFTPYRSANRLVAINPSTPMAYKARGKRERHCGIQISPKEAVARSVPAAHREPPPPLVPSRRRMVEERRRKRSHASPARSSTSTAIR